MTDVSSMVKKPVPGWVTWPIVGLAILFAAGSLVIDRADSFAFITLSLIGIALVLTRRVGLSLPLRLIGWASAAMLLVAVISYRFGIQTDIGVREVGRFVRFLGFAPLAAAFLLLDRDRRRWIWAAIPLGAILCGIVAASEMMQSHHGARAAGQSFPILFGDLSVLGAFMSALTYGILRQYFRSWALLLTWAGFVCGLVAAVFSGTRGAWLAILPLAFLLFWFNGRQSSIRRISVAAATMVAIVMFGVLNPRTGMIRRLEQARTDIHGYVKGREIAARIGLYLGCLNDKESLSRLLEYARVGGDRSAVATLEQMGSRTSSNVDGCHFDSFIRLDNRAGKHTAWVTFYRGLGGLDDVPAARILVSGKGGLRPTGQGFAVRRFDSSAFVFVDAVSSPGRMPIAVLAPPGRTIKFLPVIVVPGEYLFDYADTAVGLRLEMWRAAWMMFTRNPFLGTGAGAFKYDAKILNQNGRFAPAIAQYSHPHSEYLSQLSSRGALGLCVLLLLFSAVVFGSARGLSSRDAELVASSRCGLILVVGYAIFGFTETVFVHAMAIAYFLFFSAFFMSIVYGPCARQEIDVAAVPVDE